MIKDDFKSIRMYLKDLPSQEGIEAMEVALKHILHELEDGKQDSNYYSMLMLITDYLFKHLGKSLN